MTQTEALNKLSQKFTKNPIEGFKLQNKITNEEYKIWKKTVPLLYETIQVHILPQPSNLFQWIPNSVEIAENLNTLTCEFLLSKTDDANKCFFQIGSVELPSSLSSKINNSIPIPSGPSINPKFKILDTIPHSGEITCTRINETNKRLASFFQDGGIGIYDFLANNNPKPIGILRHHLKPGKALEWRPKSDSTMLSGSQDHSIVLWDIEKPYDPLKHYSTNHNAEITDLSWNRQNNSIFASVSKDLSLQIMDVRTDSTSSIYSISNAHRDTINAVEFHPEIHSFLATGSSDNLISLWDLRYFKKPFRSLFGITDSVTKLKFDPLQSNILSSISDDKRVYIWDLNEIGAGDFDEEIFGKDPENEDPCLRFIHGGHTDKINEVDINHELFNVYGSVGNDNLIEVWRPFFVEEEKEEDDDDEEEKDEGEDKDTKKENDDEKDITKEEDVEMKES